MKVWSARVCGYVMSVLWHVTSIAGLVSKKLFTVLLHAVIMFVAQLLLWDCLLLECYVKGLLWGACYFCICDLVYNYRQYVGGAYTIYVPAISYQDYNSMRNRAKIAGVLFY